MLKLALLLLRRPLWKHAYAMLNKQKKYGYLHSVLERVVFWTYIFNIIAYLLTKREGQKARGVTTRAQRSP